MLLCRQGLAVGQARRRFDGSTVFHSSFSPLGAAEGDFHLPCWPCCHWDLEIAADGNLQNGPFFVGQYPGFPSLGRDVRTTKKHWTCTLRDEELYVLCCVLAHFWKMHQSHSHYFDHIMCKSSVVSAGYWYYGKWKLLIHCSLEGFYRSKIKRFFLSTDSLDI